mgnify:CR=1 FL=1
MDTSTVIVQEILSQLKSQYFGRPYYARRLDDPKLECSFIECLNERHSDLDRVYRGCSFVIYDVSGQYKFEPLYKPRAYLVSAWIQLNDFLKRHSRMKVECLVLAQETFEQPSSIPLFTGYRILFIRITKGDRERILGTV